MPNKQFELVVFDLDGTLVKSDETIFKAMELALRGIGIKGYLDRRIFTNSIGLHFKDIFNAMNLQVKRFDEFINLYKEHYFDFIDHSSLYPLVKETLKELCRNEIKIALLTTKLQEQADLIIDHFNLRSYFNEVAGRRKGIAHKPDAEPLLLICELLRVDPSKTLMVGDTEMDIRCAKNAGAYSCGVSFGYRETDRLKTEEPDFIIDKLDELTKIVEQYEKT